MKTRLEVSDVSDLSVEEQIAAIEIDMDQPYWMCSMKYLRGLRTRRSKLIKELADGSKSG
jgi:hypothetical protein